MHRAPILVRGSAIFLIGRDSRGGTNEDMIYAGSWKRLASILQEAVLPP